MQVRELCISACWFRRAFCSELQLDNDALIKSGRKDYDRRYYLRYRDKKKEAQAHNYLRSKERKTSELNSDSSGGKQAYQRLYRLRHKAEMRDSQRQRYLINQDKRRESQRQYRHRVHQQPESFHPRYAAIKSWKSPASVREFFASIAPELSISHQSDWYRISRTQIREIGGAALYQKFPNLGVALQYAYPEISWDLSRFSITGKKAGQRLLKVTIGELLPGVEIVEDYNHPDLVWDNSDRPVEIDLWLPSHRIGFEFQGEHHFYNLNNAFGPNGTATLYNERDLTKISLCQSRGITLIAIPYWWDGLKDSLSATLYKARPDVFPFSDSIPIPSEMPSSKPQVRTELE